MKPLSYHYEKLFPTVLADPSFKNLEEKIIYCHILAFELEGKCCFTFDQTLAERVGLTVQQTQLLLRDLEKRKKIKMLFQPGVTARILKTTRIPEPETAQQLIDIFDISLENKI